VLLGGSVLDLKRCLAARPSGWARPLTSERCRVPVDFLLSKLLPLLVYPLGLALLLQTVSLLGRRRRWAPWLSGTGIGLLWLAAMPLASRVLTQRLERQALALMPQPLPRADAVVALGGGLLAPLPPRHSVEVGDAGDRLITALRLLRQGKADWLVVSGGSVSLRKDDSTPGEGAQASALALELGAPAAKIVANGQGRNTAEELRALDALARRRGWRSLLLVTSATHLPRAVATARRLTSVTIVPVACDFQEVEITGRTTVASLLQELLPDAQALAGTTRSLKELVGLAVYRLRGWI
jgi:uncharacterized SAM-binding protein YcdF (DUF218 family)